MNTDNNHLIDPIIYKELTDEEKKKYEPVPDELMKEAQLELMGKLETLVGKESTGSLNTWAKEKRAIKKLTKRQKNKFSLS